MTSLLVSSKIINFVAAIAGKSMEMFDKKWRVYSWENHLMNQHIFWVDDQNSEKIDREI